MAPSTLAQPNEAKFNQRYGTWWRLLPFLLPFFVLIAGAAIIQASGQRVVETAVQLAKEDAALMNWWHEDQRQTLTAQADMLAARVADGVDFAALVAEVGLPADIGYVGWLDSEKSIQGELNASALLGDPANTKLWRFVPAIGKATSDFWIEGEQPYWIAMAPVSPERGGGAVIVERPITEQTVAELAAIVGRDVVFYRYEGQTPVLSSNPALLSDPAWLSSVWLDQVASGQLPLSTLSQNSQGPLVVGMTAFYDFARLSYSGYLGLMESDRTIRQVLPLQMFWIVLALAALITAVGAWMMHTSVKSYLAAHQQMDYRVRRTVKRKLTLGLLLLLLPGVLAAGFIVVRTSNESARPDLRTASIGGDVLVESTQHLLARLRIFADSGVAKKFTSASAEELALRARQAAGVEFSVVEKNGAIGQAADEPLNDLQIDALRTLTEGQVGIVVASKTILLGARQSTTDGATVFVGLRLNKYLSQASDISGTGLTILRGQEPVVTTLAQREIEGLHFSEAVEEELQRTGRVSFAQDVGWNPGHLTAAVLDIPGPDRWRLMVSQRSITWSNGVRGYQGLGLAAVAVVLVLAGVVLITLLNVDKPLLLRRMYTGYLFILPAVVWLVWWQLGPALFTLYLSFHKWSVLVDAKPYVGLYNFRLIWTDDVFWNAMKNTVFYVTEIPLGMILALLLALALNRPLKGIRALRTIYYMPAVTSVVVVSLMWKLLYNKDLGIFNYLLSFVNLGPYGFLQSTTMVLPSIMAMTIWLGLGSRMILFLAGLQSIPNDYYEAADVDGASGFRKFWHITLPLLAPTTFFVMITSVIGSFQVFGPVYVLTQGGPNGASDVAVHRIYFEAWQNLRFGYASAETVVLFAILFVVTIVQFRYFGRNVNYGG
jgi:multiple sugar transport system permease protein